MNGGRDSLKEEFEVVLDRLLAATSGSTVGASAGWCLPTAVGGDRGIVYAGAVEPRGAEPIVGPPGPETLWQIGSVSKTFTATLLALSAAAAPELLTARVEPDIGRWLGPRTIDPPQLTAITYNRLASMWAGLVDSNRRLDAGSGVGTGSGDGFPVADMLGDLLDRRSYTDQPCGWLYSDLSIAVLGWALTSVYGVAPTGAAELPAAFLELLRNRLLEPLTIEAGWAADADPDRLPVGWVDGRRTTELNPNWPATDPAGALTLTAPDLLAWVAANLAPGSVIGGPALQLLRTPIVPTGRQADTESGGRIATGGSSCRGWFLIPSPQDGADGDGGDVWIYNKNGRVPGFTASVAYARPDGLDGASPAGVFVTVNDSSKGLRIERIAEELLSLAATVSN